MSYTLEYFSCDQDAEIRLELDIEIEQTDACDYPYYSFSVIESYKITSAEIDFGNGFERMPVNVMASPFFQVELERKVERESNEIISGHEDGAADYYEEPA